MIAVCTCRDGSCKLCKERKRESDRYKERAYSEGKKCKYCNRPVTNPNKTGVCKLCKGSHPGETGETNRVEFGDKRNPSHTGIAPGEPMSVWYDLPEHRGNYPTVYPRRLKWHNGLNPSC